MYVPIRVKTSCLYSRAFSVRPSVHPSVSAVLWCIQTPNVFAGCRFLLAYNTRDSRWSFYYYLRACACVCVWAACNNNIVYIVVFVVGIVIGRYIYYICVYNIFWFLYIHIYILWANVYIYSSTRREGKKTQNFSGLFFFRHTTFLLCAAFALHRHVLYNIIYYNTYRYYYKYYIYRYIHPDPLFIIYTRAYWYYCAWCDTSLKILSPCVVILHYTAHNNNVYRYISFFFK